MTSVISICNMALSNLGAGNIQSLGEASTEARSCTQWYEHTRDTLLQAYPWRFAGTAVSLAELTNDKPGAWGYSYRRPSDCLKPRFVRREFSTTDEQQTMQEQIQNPYLVEGTRIYCDISPAILNYTRRVEDPSLFSPLFVTALSFALTVNLAMPITQDPKIRNDAYQIAEQMRERAAAADANEQRETSDHDSEFHAVRG